MQTTKFTLSRLKRVIAMQGKSYTFSRFGEDAYHQPNATFMSSHTIQGVYHESSAYSPLSASESARVNTKPQPMLLAEFGPSSELKKGDTAVIAGKTYKVTDVRDVANFGVIGEVSLEVVV